MKRPEAPRLQLDNRTLWEAIRAAGGNVPTAARSLGLTTRELLLQLAGSGLTWRGPEQAISGTRRRQESKPQRDPDDEPAWGDESE